MNIVFILFHQLRPLHWMKNLLIFLPLVVSRDFSAFQVDVGLFLFLSWSLTASAIYGINDMADLEADKMHPFKKRRPIASGALPLRYVKVLVMVLLVLGAVLGYFCGSLTLICLGLYLLGNLIYSFWLKGVAYFELIFLTSFYVLRVLSGYRLIYDPVSFWLIGATVLFFFGLAASKRQYDLSFSLQGRGYLPSDRVILRILTFLSWISLSIFLYFYAGSHAASELFSSPKRLLYACPVLGLMGWQLTRYESDRLSNGFTEAVLRDPVSYLCLGLFLGSAYMAV